MSFPPPGRDEAPPLPPGRRPIEYLDPEIHVEESRISDPQIQLLSREGMQNGRSAAYNRASENVTLQYPPGEIRGLTNQNFGQYFMKQKDTDWERSFALRHLNAILVVCLTLGMLGLVALVLSGLIVAGMISVPCQCSATAATDASQGGLSK